MRLIKIVGRLIKIFAGILFFLRICESFKKYFNFETLST